jgi:C1A family cysteine protease
MPVKKVVVSKKDKKKIVRYGWVPDVPDQRDYLLSAVLRVPKKLPVKVDLRPFCPQVEDQGQLGSCTANALAGALEFLERKDNVAFEDFSRLFIYYNERAIEHTIQSDSGAMRRNGRILFRNSRLNQPRPVTKTR